MKLFNFRNAKRCIVIENGIPASIKKVFPGTYISKKGYLIIKK